MKLLPIYAAAAIMAASSTLHAQDDLDNVAKGLAATPTPAPVAAATPAATPRTATATATPPSRTTAVAAPRPTAPATPRSEAKPDLSRARFVQEGDLAGLSGQKLSGVYLTGIYKATGEKIAGRTVFTTRSVVPILGVVRGSTRILVRFPKPPNPQLLAAGNSSQWAKESPLHLERVEQTRDGITAYATDTP